MPSHRIEVSPVVINFVYDHTITDVPSSSSKTENLADIDLTEEQTIPVKTPSSANVEWVMSLKTSSPVNIEAEQEISDDTPCDN